MKLFSKYALASVVNNGGGLGFGCMGITAFYGASLADDKAMTLLKAVYDAGCRHFDTAEVYATKEKHNEDILGQFFQTVPRDSFSVATKYWPRSETYDYDTVKASLTASLKRLQLSYVDLYYAHRLTTLDGALEFGRTARRLREEGLIREVGVSEVSAAWLEKIHKEAGPIDAIQIEWSLLTRNVEDDLIPMCKDLGITVVAYSPLARNLLASKIETTPDDWRGQHPRYAKENIETNKKISEQVHDLAEKYGCTAAELSLAWLFHKAEKLGVSLIPIPGSTKMQHALGNLGAAKIKITDENDVATLESLADKVAGARANESYLQATFESQGSTK